MVVWVFVLLVVALIGRLWVSLGVVTAVTALLGAVNSTKLELRNDPLVPSDIVFLGQPGFLFDMVSKSKLRDGRPRPGRHRPARVGLRLAGRQAAAQPVAAADRARACSGCGSPAWSW